MINTKGMETVKESIRGMDKAQAVEIKGFLDGFVNALGIDNIDKFRYQQAKNWEILNHNSNKVKKDVLDKVKDNKGIGKNEFNTQEQIAILLLLAEGIIYEPEKDKYAVV